MSQFLLSQRIGNIKRALRRNFESLAVQHDITVTQFQVLRRLWEGDGLNAQTLAREAHLDAATMTGVIDRLELKGLLRRERDESDRRALRIFLSDAGRALQTPLLEARAKNNEIALAGFSAKEKTQLLDLLARVEHNLHKGDEES